MAILGFSIGKIHTIRNYLQINGRSHIGVKEFEKLNWPQVSERLDQYLWFNASKSFNPLYLYNIYMYI